MAAAFILFFIILYFGANQFLVALEIGVVIINIINIFSFVLLGWMRSK